MFTPSVRNGVFGATKCLLWLISCYVASIDPALASRLYKINENESARILGSLPVDFNLKSQYDPDTLSSFTYDILNEVGPYVGYFSVDPKTGVFSTTGDFDREAVCGWVKECILKVDIAAYFGSIFDVLKAEVLINDVNDEPPVFSESETHVTVPESSRVNSLFYLPIAQDRDSRGPNSDVEYKLTQTSGVFDIDVKRDDDESVSEVSLVLKGELDRERLDNYQMVLYAVDRGNPSLTGSMIISVTVGDINDHKPVFHKPKYEENIYENKPRGTVILKVHARDMDTGPNAKIKYTISSRADKSVNKYLSLNPDSGEITVKNIIDYEKVQKFEFKVEASDSSPQPLKTRTTVIIHVKDVNDNTPVIHMNYLFRKDHAEIPENSQLGALVAHFSITDDDSNKSGEVYCDLHDSNFKLKAMKGGKRYQILLNTDLDREMLDEYTLKLTCIDKGTPPKTVTEVIRLTVTDKNDCRPKFVQRKYRGSIPENSRPGTPLLRVKATDCDIGANGDITFSLADHVKSFQVHPEKGDITSAMKLDREATPIITFSVYAWDGGKTPSSDVATVNVQVLDLNDEEPVFVKDHYEFTVNEKHKGVIGYVNATDKDSGQGGEITYSIPTYEDGAFFQIESDTGAITSKVELDSDTKGEYNFGVKASDGGYPILWTKSKVTIYVDDINDNTPIISPLPNNGTLEIPKNVKKGTHATSIIARDGDTGRNGQLSYSIQSSCFGCFRIDQQGHLYVTRLKDNVRVYTVIVSVSDNGKPPLTAKTNITIFIVKPLLVTSDQSGAGGKGKGKDSEGIQGENLIIVIGVVVGTVVICGVIVTFICILRHNNSQRTPVKTNSGDSPDAKFTDPPNNATIRPQGCTYKSFRIDSNGEDKLTVDMDNGGITDGQYQLMCRTKPTWTMDSPRHERNVCPVPPYQVTDDGIIDPGTRTLSHNNTFQMSPSHKISHPNGTINIPPTYKPSVIHNNNNKRAHSAGNLHSPSALYNELRRMRPEEEHGDRTSCNTSNSDSGKGGSEDSHGVSIRPSHVTLSEMDPAVKLSTKGVSADYV